MPQLTVSPQPSITPFTPSSHQGSIGKLQAILARGYAEQNDLNLLKQIFGSELVERTCLGLWNTSPRQLEKRALLEMLAAIGHGVTLKDLEGCFRQIQENALQYEILSLLKWNHLDRYSSIYDLPQDQFDELIQLFKNPLKFLEDKELWEELETGPVTNKKSLAYSEYDYKVRKLLGADHSRPEFRFAAPEQIAKKVAYAKPESLRDGMIIPIFREENGPEIVHYQMASHLNKNGLHAYLFTPIGRDDLPAQLVFRGTFGLASIQRDIDNSGVGKTVFDACAPDILAMVEKAAKQAPHFKLDVIGHSLGAADAQRAAALLLDHHLNGTGSINSLEKLSLFAYCSPKIDRGTVQQWDRNLKKLADKDSPCQIELHFAQHESDSVTWAGDLNLHGAKNASFIQTYHLMVKSPQGMAGTHDHHTKPFFEFGTFDTRDGRTFQLFQSTQYEKAKNRFEELESKDWAEVSLDLDVEDSLSLDEGREKAQLQERLQELDAAQVTIEESQKGWAQQSWVVWTMSQALARPFKTLGYFSLALVNALKA